MKSDSALPPTTSSGCCAPAATAPTPSAKSAAATASSPCCGGPNPDPSSSACCVDPSPTCGCQAPGGNAKTSEPSALSTMPSAATEETGRKAAATLPIAVIGAGPIGLAAAAHLLEKGETPLVFEAGADVGASMRDWSHVRVFSPWKYLVDPAARRLLETAGWEMPDENSLPTGGEIAEQMLEPLAAHPMMQRQLRLRHRVLAVSRLGYDKVKTTGRDAAPFELVVRTPDGRVERFLARAVIDASGSWNAPNPIGAGGLPADGEAEHADRIRYGIPDVLGVERSRYAGRRTLVIGSGHSAFNALLDLARLADGAPGTEITWAIRRTDAGLLFGGGERDQLPARGALGSGLRALLDAGRLHFVRGFRAARVSAQGRALAVESDEGLVLGPLDQIIVATGFRPDLSLGRELRLRLDPWLEAPEQLAPLIDPNKHSCGTVYPHGAFELAHPEKDYYVVGMKSYGRAPTFLMLTGYEQVRSVACALVGDEAGARNVELVLPETGVCRTDLADADVACCSTAEEPALATLALAGR
jgi:glycine/D-amino acid oxidase-like deaminating enzyme